jgi:hypothetical protein
LKKRILVSVLQNTTTDVNSKHKRQGTYKRNTEARSRNHCCCGKAVSIKYYDYVSVFFR